jgi:beta-glucanase (GH16 family)
MTQDCYTARVQTCTWIKSTTTDCIQQAQQSKHVCTQTADHGYQSCTNWGKNCCTWIPCKWACQAFTMICLASVWIANLVCVAYADIVEVVCVVSVLVEHWTCTAMSWVSYVICRIPEHVENAQLAVGNEIYVHLSCAFGKDTERNPQAKPGWNLMFEDDFTSPSLDANKWQTLPYYSDGTEVKDAVTGWSAANVVMLAPSELGLKNDDVPMNYVAGENPTTYSQRPFSGAGIWWANGDPSVPRPDREQQHGYFEIRCKVPSAPDMWTAFWLVSRQAWPPEIDVFEFYSGDNEHYQATHHWGLDDKKFGPDAHKKQTATIRVCHADRLFHIYACEWHPGIIRYYLDNRLVRVSTDGLSEFVYPMLVVADTSVDSRPGHNPAQSVYPNTYEIDYIRVYAQ